MGFITLKGHSGCNMKGRRERAEVPAKCAVRSLAPSPWGRLMEALPRQVAEGMEGNLDQDLLGSWALR